MIDPKVFFGAWRDAFGPLSQAEVDGINALIAEMEGRGWSDPRWWAYTLATAWHETAHRMEPIEEYGNGKGRPYGAVDPETGHAFFGRGFVQLTWKENYDRMGKRLGLDLVNNPALALDPAHAAAIMCEGMEHGLFTGKGLPDYFDHDSDDPRNARRIVNGVDRADLIAGYHRKALGAVGAAWTGKSPAPPPDSPQAPDAALAARVAALEAFCAEVSDYLSREGPSL